MPDTSFERDFHYRFHYRFEARLHPFSASFFRFGAKKVEESVTGRNHRNPQYFQCFFVFLAVKMVLEVW